MNYIEQALKGINKEMRTLEKEKAASLYPLSKREQIQEILSNDTELSEFPGWSVTSNEDIALTNMQNKLRGYKAKHEIQKNVLDFLNGYGYGYMVLLKEDFNTKDLNSYIDASAYWNKKHTILTLPEDREMKWVFAENKDMMSVICLFMGWYIICTESSHKNIMDFIEGKQFKKTKSNLSTKKRLEIAGAHIEYIDNDLIQMMDAVPENNH